MRDKEYKPYTAKRWTDIPGFTMVEETEFAEEKKRELSQEEKKQRDEKWTEILRKYKAIKEDEIVIGENVVKIEQK